MKIILKYPLLTGILPSLCVNSFASRGMGSVASNQLWMGPRTMLMLSRLICRASGLANLEAVSTLIAVKFKQEETLIPHLIRMGIDIPANLLGAYVIPRIGVWKAIFGGYFFHVILGLLSDMWPIWLMVRLTRAASRALLSGCGVGAELLRLLGLDAVRGWNVGNAFVLRQVGWHSLEGDDSAFRGRDLRTGGGSDDLHAGLMHRQCVS